MTIVEKSNHAFKVQVDKGITMGASQAKADRADLGIFTHIPVY